MIRYGTDNPDFGGGVIRNPRLNGVAPPEPSRGLLAKLQAEYGGWPGPAAAVNTPVGKDVYEEKVRRGPPNIIIPQFMPYPDDQSGESPAMRLAYRRMALGDPNVKAALLGKVLAVAALDLKIQPANKKDKRSQEIAEFTRWTLNEQLGGPPKLVAEIVLPGLMDGYSVCEKVIGPPTFRGKWGQKAPLIDLAGIDVGNDVVLETDDRNRLVSLLGLRFNPGNHFNPADFVVWSHLSLFGRVTGSSDCRAAFRAYWVIDTAWKLRLMMLQFRAGGLLVGKYTNATVQSSLQATLAAARTHGWITLPPGAELEVVNMAGSGEDAFATAMKDAKHDVFLAISGAVLQNIEGDTTDGRGDTTVHLSEAELRRWWLAKELETILNGTGRKPGLIKDVVDLNYTEVDEYPRASLGAVDQAEVQARLAVYVGAKQLGLKLSRSKVAEDLDVEEADPNDMDDALPDDPTPPTNGPGGLPGKPDASGLDKPPQPEKPKPAPGAEDFAEDAQGHEHAGAGKGGGRFVSKGKGPTGDHAALHGAAKAHEDAKAAYQAAIASHKEARKAAHEKEAGHATKRLENAVAHAQKAYDIANSIELDEQDRPQAEEAYAAIDLSLHALIHEEDGASMRSDLAEVVEAAEALRDAPDAMPSNVEAAKKILELAKSVKAELKAHRQHRRTMKAIREGDAENFVERFDEAFERLHPRAGDGKFGKGPVAQERTKALHESLRSLKAKHADPSLASHQKRALRERMHHVRTALIREGWRPGVNDPVEPKPTEPAAKQEPPPAAPEHPDVTYHRQLVDHYRGKVAKHEKAMKEQPSEPSHKAMRNMAQNNLDEAEIKLAQVDGTPPEKVKAMVDALNAKRDHGKEGDPPPAKDFIVGQIETARQRVEEAPDGMARKGRQDALDFWKGQLDKYYPEEAKKPAPSPQPEPPASPALTEVHGAKLYGSRNMIASAEPIQHAKLQEANAAFHKAVADLTAKGDTTTADQVRTAFAAMGMNRDARYWLNNRNKSGLDMLRQAWKERFHGFAEWWTHAEDASGHEHKGKGPGGGQFTGGGGSSEGKSKFTGQIVGHKEKQRADEIEKEVARAIGARWEEDSKPYDANTKDGKHFIEVKSKLMGKKKEISVHDDALYRKVKLLEEHPGATFHTVVVDERNTYDNGAHAEHYSGNRMYYKRGNGRYTPSQMHPVKSAAELKRLVNMADHQLPEAARGGLPTGEAAAKLKESAEKAHASRLRKDQARKARLKAEGKSAYQRQT